MVSWETQTQVMVAWETQTQMVDGEMQVTRVFLQSVLID